MVGIRLGSLLVGSDQVDAMKTWYRRAFGWQENAMGAFDAGGVQLFVELHGLKEKLTGVNEARVVRGILA